MIQRKFYLPEEMYFRLQMTAKMANQTITQILRDFIAAGLENAGKQTKSQSSKMLFELAQKAKEEHWGNTAPADFSQKHDKYFAQIENSKKHKK